MLAICRLKSILGVIIEHSVSPALFHLAFSFVAEFKHNISQCCFSACMTETHQQVSSRCATICTLSRVDKRSVWHASKESCCFVTLVVL